MDNIGTVVRMEPSTFGFNMYSVGKGYSIGVIDKGKLSIKNCEILKIRNNKNTSEAIATVSIEGYENKVDVRLSIIKTKSRHVDSAIEFS